jgi:prophage regulatory protein
MTEMSPARSQADIAQELLRRKQILELLGVSHSTLYSWMDAGKFPRPIRIGENSIAWLRTEIEAWLEQRAQERRA